MVGLSTEEFLKCRVVWERKRFPQPHIWLQSPGQKEYNLFTHLYQSLKSQPSWEIFLVRLSPSLPLEAIRSQDFIELPCQTCRLCIILTRINFLTDPGWLQINKPSTLDPRHWVHRYAVPILAQPIFLLDDYNWKPKKQVRCDSNI